MNPYTILLGVVGLIMFYSAWCERRAGNTRDGWALTFCGSGMCAFAGFFGFVFR